MQYSRIGTLTTMVTSVERVKLFHERFEHPIGNIAGLEPVHIRKLRIGLLHEELAELAVAGDVRREMYDLCKAYVEACEEDYKSSPDAEYKTFEQWLVNGDRVNKVEELDAIQDIQYVLDGKKLTSGLWIIDGQAFLLVHDNNMRKAHLSPEHVQETAEKLGKNLACVERPGGVYVAVNEKHKVIKPHDHTKVSLAPLVEQAMAEAKDLNNEEIDRLRNEQVQKPLEDFLRSLNLAQLGEHMSQVMESRIRIFYGQLLK